MIPNKFETHQYDTQYTETQNLLIPNILKPKTFWYPIHCTPKPFDTQWTVTQICVTQLFDTQNNVSKLFDTQLTEPQNFLRPNLLNPKFYWYPTYWSPTLMIPNYMYHIFFKPTTLIKEGLDNEIGSLFHYLIHPWANGSAIFEGLDNEIGHQLAANFIIYSFSSSKWISYFRRII